MGMLTLELSVGRKPRLTHSRGNDRHCGDLDQDVWSNPDGYKREVATHVKPRHVNRRWVCLRSASALIDCTLGNIYFM